MTRTRLREIDHHMRVRIDKPRCDNQPFCVDGTLGRYRARRGRADKDDTISTQSNVCYARCDAQAINDATTANEDVDGDRLRAQRTWRDHADTQRDHAECVAH